nr:MAG TPA: hypothetical protein [Caudoviricetes sp.]
MTTNKHISHKRGGDGGGAVFNSVFGLLFA